MKFSRQFSVVMLSGLFCISTAQAAGNFSQSAGVRNNGAQASQYNPWRPQPRQWGYQNKRNNGNGNGNGHAGQTHYGMPQSRYVIPQSPIPSRRYEYRRYIQEVNPYYDSAGPWWAGHGAAPYGPWAIGNGWPNGIW